MIIVLVFTSDGVVLVCRLLLLLTMIVISICQILPKWRGFGVIHGDVKPDNIVVDMPYIWPPRQCTSAEMARATVHLLDCESFLQGAFETPVAVGDDGSEATGGRSAAHRDDTHSRSGAVDAVLRVQEESIRGLACLRCCCCCCCCSCCCCSCCFCRLLFSFLAFRLVW